VEHYDLIVIGSGAGMNVAAPAVNEGLRVAVVDKDPLGGTCLNRGCIPSKVWTTAADAVREAEAARAIGVDLALNSVDYPRIRERVWEIVLEGRHGMEAGVAETPNVDFLNGEGRFVSDMTLEVAGERITSDRIVIATGARPHIPALEGLDSVKYLTNRNIFELERLPASATIVGGGYIACELAHFLSAMGTEVTLVGRNERLLPGEDPEVSEAALRVMSRHMAVHAGAEVLAVSPVASEGVRVVAVDRTTGAEVIVESEALVLASGRESNADRLEPWHSGVEVDADGWIRTNDYLETTRQGVWALGDCVNRGQFRHTANSHSGVVLANAFGKERQAVDERAIPSAVFGWPQVGSVGLQEAEAIAAGHHVHVGRARYHDTAKGFALGDEDAFVKVVVDAHEGRILGAAVVGPQASVLVQLVVDMMVSGAGTYEPIVTAQIIHPALTEVVARAFGSLGHPEGAPGGHEA